MVEILTIDAVRDKLEEFKARNATNFTGAEKKFIDRVYRRIFNKEVSNKGCNSCYKEAFIEIYCQVKKLKELPDMSAYRLKNGVVYTEPFTNHSYVGEVKDEDAERILSKFPAMIKKFARYPDDWEARCNKEAKGKRSRKPKEPEQPKPVEAQAPQKAGQEQPQEENPTETDAEGAKPQDNE